jgi:hypothetical protein
VGLGGGRKHELRVRNSSVWTIFDFLAFRNNIFPDVGLATSPCSTTLTAAKLLRLLPQRHSELFLYRVLFSDLLQLHGAGLNLNSCPDDVRTAQK